MTELSRSEEETERRPARGMVDAVRASDLPQVGDALEKPHRQSPMHEAVVHDDVRETEERHPEARAEGELARERGRGAATVEHERNRHWRVEKAQAVVRFERVFTATVVRGVDWPEPAMPDAPMEERCPEIHRYRDDRRGPEPDEDVRDHDDHLAERRR